MITLDTSILSQAFRRPRSVERRHPAVAILERMLRDQVPHFVPAIAFQEYLSQTRSAEQYQRLERLISDLPIRPATVEEHRLAGRISSACRWRGLAVTPVDCLIAAQTVNADAELFTLDADFSRIALVSGLRLLRF